MDDRVLKCRWDVWTFEIEPEMAKNVENEFESRIFTLKKKKKILPERWYNALNFDSQPTSNLSQPVWFGLPRFFLSRRNESYQQCI